MLFKNCSKNRVSPHLMECVALREGLEFAESIGLKISIVKSDAANVMKAVNKKCTPIADGVVMEDVCLLLSDLSGGVCNYISRLGKTVTHQLAFKALSCSVSFKGPFFGPKLLWLT